MADETLQAFQLGASLFDRAQTQKRMMEQFQLQSAESLLQQQGLQLQNKIRDISLADAIGEQKSQVEEFDAFSTLGKQVSDYLNNPKPDAKFPVVPAFKSKQYRIEADRMLNNLEKYSARAELLKARDRAEATSNTLRASTINKAIDAGAWIGFNQDGSPNIDVPKMNAYYEKIGSSKIGQSEAKTASLLGNLDISRDKLRIAAANLDRLTREGASKIDLDKAKSEFDQALKTEEALLKEKRYQLDVETKGRQLDINQQKADTAKTKAESGGKLPAPTKLDLDELEFSEAVLNGIKPLEPYLSQDIFGPAFNIKVKAGEVFGGSLPEKTVNQFYENMRTGALFKRGGKALTKTEVDRVTSSIGKPTDVGFSDRIDTFKEITARSIKDRVEKLRMQGITSNPQYGAYVNELERRADEILGVETAPQQQSEIRTFETIEEAQSANLPIGTRIFVKGRGPATIK
jgi:hypothetical protein